MTGVDSAIVEFDSAHDRQVTYLAQLVNCDWAGGIPELKHFRIGDVHRWRTEEPTKLAHLEHRRTGFGGGLRRLPVWFILLLIGLADLFGLIALSIGGLRVEELNLRAV